MIFQLFQHETFLNLLIAVPIITIIPVFLLFLFFFKDFLKTKQKMFKYLSLLFATYLIQHSFEIGQYIFTHQEEVRLFFIIYQIFNILTLYMLVIVLEMFDRNALTSNRHTLLSIITFITIGGLISTNSFEVQPLGNTFFVRIVPLSTIMVMRVTFNVVASLWLIIMLWKSRSLAGSPIQKNFISWLFIGVIFAILLPMFPNTIWDALSEIPLQYLIIGFLIGIAFQNGGMLIIGIAFFRVSKTPWLLQQQKVHLLVVYSKEGIQLFSKSFENHLTAEDTILMAGGFSAIASLFKEATNTSGEIKAILLEGKELRIIKRPFFMCALLVDFSTQASEEAHEKFSLEFELEFMEHLKNFTGEITAFREADQILTKYFS